MKLGTWLVNARPLPKVVAMMANVSIVAKKGGSPTFGLDLMLIRSVATQRSTVPTLVCSKGPAAFARKKVTQLLNVPTNLHPNASTASRKVSHHSSQSGRSLVADTAPGHQTSECKANRVFDTSRVADMSAEDAWEALQKADEERDLEDFREVRGNKRCLYKQKLTSLIRPSESTPR